MGKKLSEKDELMKPIIELIWMEEEEKSSDDALRMVNTCIAPLCGGGQGDVPMANVYFCG